VRIVGAEVARGGAETLDSAGARAPATREAWATPDDWTEALAAIWLSPACRNKES